METNGVSWSYFAKGLDLFSFRDTGLDLTSVQQWNISGCEFYNYGDGYNVGGDCKQQNAVDLSVSVGDTVSITGCRFNRTSQISAPNRINILINPQLTPSTSPTQRFLIAHNQFGDRVSGGGAFGISAIRVNGTASDIQIGHNDYIGTYSSAIIDDQAGAVVAPLGYPSGAVTPNLGSGGATDARWPDYQPSMDCRLQLSSLRSGRQRSRRAPSWLDRMGALLV